jgi:hypothetical protein
MLLLVVLAHAYDSILITTILQADRPLILIGLSVGGLLVKNALVRACETSSAHPIVSCLAGVVFLGTPHPHTSQAAGEFLTRLDSLSTSDLPSSQAPSSKAYAHTLEKLEIRFRSILKRSLPQLQLVSFYETRTLNGPLVREADPHSVTSLTNIKIVGESDCVLEPFVSIPLDVDHEVRVQAIEIELY